MLFFLLALALAAHTRAFDWPQTCGGAPQTLVDARGAAELAPLWQKYDSEARFDTNSKTFRNDFSLGACTDGVDALCTEGNITLENVDRGLYLAIKMPITASGGAHSIATGTRLHLAYTLTLTAKTEFTDRKDASWFGPRHYVLVGAQKAWPYLGGSALMYAPGFPHVGGALGNILQPLLAVLPLWLHGDMKMTCTSRELGRCDARIANRSSVGQLERTHVDVTFAVTAPARIAVAEASVENDKHGTIFHAEQFPNATSEASLDGDTAPYVAIVTLFNGMRLENMRMRVTPPPCLSQSTLQTTAHATARIASAAVYKQSTPDATTTTTTVRQPESTTESADAANERLLIKAPSDDSSFNWLPFAFAVAIVCVVVLACALARNRIGRSAPWYSVYYGVPDALRPCVCFACRCTDAWDEESESQSDNSGISLPSYMDTPPASPQPSAPPPAKPRQRTSTVNDEYSALPIWSNEPAEQNVYDRVSDSDLRVDDNDTSAFQSPPQRGDVNYDLLLPVNTDYTDCSRTLLE